jgi:hypothetical protein
MQIDHRNRFGHHPCLFSPAWALELWGWGHTSQLETIHAQTVFPTSRFNRRVDKVEPLIQPTNIIYVYKIYTIRFVF